MSVAVKAGDLVLAEQTHEPGVVRCTALLSDGYVSRRCNVLIQRAASGDLAAGVVEHYAMCHPERKIR